MEGIERINKAIDEFAGVMKSRMADKHREGYRGWDGKYHIPYLCDKIARDAHKIQFSVAHDKAAIDIGARAMMLWYRHKNEH